jgi:CRP/FNR family transcriptional regulator
MEQTKLWYLEDFDLFQSMTKEEIESVEEHVFTLHLKRGERINFAKNLNKYVYLVNEGVLKVVARDEEGKETIVCLTKKGNIFGALPLLGDFELPEDYAEAIEDSAVSFIDTEKLHQWMTNNHDLRTKIRAHIGQKLQRIENRLLSMIFKDAKTRIHDFLVEFVKEFGIKTENGYEVKNFLTNDEVAKLTATSRQTVNSILNELRDQKMIEYNKDILFIPFSSGLLRE